MATRAINKNEVNTQRRGKMETVNQETMSEETQNTFTQEEVNKMIGERLSREREKYANYDELKAKAEKYDEVQEASKTELQKAEERANDLQAKYDSMIKADTLRKIREKVSEETGVPASLLNADTEEACKTQAEAILAFKGTAPAYPSIKDKGEVTKLPANAKTRDQFANWFEKSVKQ